MKQKRYANWARYILTFMLAGGVWSYLCLYEPGELSTLKIISLFPFYIGYGLMIAGLKRENFRYRAAGALSCCLSAIPDLLDVFLTSGPFLDYVYYLVTAAAYLFVFLTVRKPSEAKKWGQLGFEMIIARSLLEFFTTRNAVIIITLPVNMLLHGLPLLLIGMALDQSTKEQNNT
ncbi:MAG: hypothetical protein J6V25_00645 [Oscillospiraceae bacterium]|nr:hypothetical protein [Oscillospiraceae bacterium]